MQEQTEIQADAINATAIKEIFTVGKLREVRDLINANNGIYQKIPSPFGWACVRTIEKIDSAIKKYDQELIDKQRELALTYKEGDKKGCYITNGPHEILTHTAEALKKINDFLISQKDIEVEYEPYFATNFDEIKGNLKVLNIINSIIIKRINLEEYVNNSVIS